MQERSQAMVVNEPGSRVRPAMTDGTMLTRRHCEPHPQARLPSTMAYRTSLDTRVSCGLYIQPSSDQLKYPERVMIK